MNDFLKIFIVLCACVGAFMFGRNYGESTFKETPEFRELAKAKEELNFTKSELENVKIKFQNILDGSETRKQEEILGQVLQIFLADLGLRASNPEAFVKAKTTTTPSVTAKAESKKPTVEKPVAGVENHKSYDYRRLKSYEWILLNSSNGSDLRKNLKNVEIKSLNSFLSGASRAPYSAIENLFGTYRGRIMDITNNEYGSLAISLSALTRPTGDPGLSGSIKIFRNGTQEMNYKFTADTYGFVAPGTSGYILDYENRFFQIYKVAETNQLVGFYYERMINGTTKTIGSFVLNKTDQF